MLGVRRDLGLPNRPKLNQSHIHEHVHSRWAFPHMVLLKPHITSYKCFSHELVPFRAQCWDSLSIPLTFPLNIFHSRGKFVATSLRMKTSFPRRVVFFMSWSALNTVCRQHCGFTFHLLRELVFRSELRAAQILCHVNESVQSSSHTQS